LHSNRSIDLVALLQACWSLYAFGYDMSGTAKSTFEIIQLQGYPNWQNLSPPLARLLMQLANKPEP